MQTKRKKMIKLSKFIDLTGQKFGKLTVIKRADDYISPKGNHFVRWLCKCDCGNEAIVAGSSLRAKNGTKSCGCINKEKSRDRMLKHGLYGQRIYRIYKGMKERCYKKYCINYEDYGNRGIKICDEWLGDCGFINFYNWAISNGYKDDLSIDRINVDGDYEPNNCRWITNIEQQNNKRNNIKVLYNNKYISLLELSKETNINFNTLKGRICNYGWSVEKAISTPVRKYTKNKNNKEAEREELKNAG